MLCVVIKGPTFEEAHQQIAQAALHADVVELRLDGFTSRDLAADLKKLRSHFPIPMIFTLRACNKGQSEGIRLATIRSLAELNPEYLDLESHISPRFIEEIASQFPEIKLILSYHHFTETPDNLEAIYQDMQKIPARFYKIAVTAKNSLDALRLMCWANPSDGKLIAISMGCEGQVSRILGPVMGCPITYTALAADQQSAPGQLTATTLIERYHHRSLNPATALYGLIGHPVDQSISDETHNSWITSCGLDAVYVKIPVRPSELSDFLHYAKQLPFQGFSVTMPLKEAILPLLDAIDSHALDIGAINTLCIEEGKIFGYNTDGMGALNTIERQCLVKGKRIVIMGAGGSAKAIAYEAHRRGGLVTIVNRDVEKAEQIARRLSCVGRGLCDMARCAEEGYEILINCIPAGWPMAADVILPQAIVMDIVTKPKETLLLKLAKEKGCRVIYGYQMFIEQALGQFHLWFKDHSTIQDSRSFLEQKVRDCL